jgi:hypothetical protein
MKKITLVAALAATIGAANAATIHTWGSDGFAGGSQAVGDVLTSWQTIGVNNTANSYTSAAIAGNADGEAFTYTVTVTGFGLENNLGLNTDEGGTLSDGTGSGNTITFADGEGFDVSITILTGNVKFDGFTSFANGANANAEGSVVNGTSYRRNNATGVQGIGGTPFWNLAGAPEATFVSRSDGATVGRFVEGSFSAVPEPSSTALLGLGSLALILRRRK